MGDTEGKRTTQSEHNGREINQSPKIPERKKTTRHVFKPDSKQLTLSEAKSVPIPFMSSM